MSAYIKIEINAGTTIEVASAIAVRTAKLLGINVEFRFNDVTCYAAPDGDPVILAENWLKELRRELLSPHDSRFATSRP